VKVLYILLACPKPLMNQQFFFNLLNGVSQLHKSGWSNFIFPQAKISYPVGPKWKETPPGTLLKNNQFSLSLKIIIQK
jgi:hypothetical protein